MVRDKSGIRTDTNLKSALFARNHAVVSADVTELRDDLNVTKWWLNAGENFLISQS